MTEFFNYNFHSASGKIVIKNSYPEKKRQVKRNWKLFIRVKYFKINSPVIFFF